MYLVVHFVEEDTYEVACKNWLKDALDDTIYFPPKTHYSKINSMLRQKTPVQSSWNIYNCTILFEHGTSHILSHIILCIIGYFLPSVHI